MHLDFWRWRLVLDTGCNRYYEHARTGARKCVHSMALCQPVDQGWLDGGDFTVDPRLDSLDKITANLIMLAKKFAFHPAFLPGRKCGRTFALDTYTTLIHCAAELSVMSGSYEHVQEVGTLILCGERQKPGA